MALVIEPMSRRDWTSVRFIYEQSVAEGTAMLQDGIFTTEEFLADAANQDITERFLRASFKGWM